MSPIAVSPLRFLCFGLGAIGTYIGGSLLDAGDEVVFIERLASVKSVEQQGIKLKLKDRTISIPRVKIAGSIQTALETGKFDVAILAVKSFDTASILDEIRPFKEQFPPVLCLQNGVENEGLIAVVIGEENVIGGSVTSAISRVSIGDAIVEKSRGVGIDSSHPLSAALIEHFDRAGLMTLGYVNRGSLKWSKMLTNLQANALPAILHWTPTQVLSNPLTYAIECAALREALAVMQKLNIEVVNLPGTPVRPWISAMTKFPEWLSRPLIARVLGSGRGDKLPSLHIDLYAGKKLNEVVFLNGAVVRFANANGLSAPVNTVLTQTLEGMALRVLPFERFNNHPEVLNNLIEEQL